MGLPDTKGPGWELLMCILLFITISCQRPGPQGWSPSVSGHGTVRMLSFEEGEVAEGQTDRGKDNPAGCTMLSIRGQAQPMWRLSGPSPEMGAPLVGSRSGGVRQVVSLRSRVLGAPTPPNPPGCPHLAPALCAAARRPQMWGWLL